MTFGIRFDVDATAPVAPKERAFNIFESEPQSTLKSLPSDASIYDFRLSILPLESLIPTIYLFSDNTFTTYGLTLIFVLAGIL